MTDTTPIEVTALPLAKTEVNNLLPSKQVAPHNDSTQANDREVKRFFTGLTEQEGLINDIQEYLMPLLDDKRNPDMLSIGCGHFPEGLVWAALTGGNAYGIDVSKNNMVIDEEDILDAISSNIISPSQEIVAKEADARKDDSYIFPNHAGGFDVVMLRHPYINFNKNQELYGAIVKQMIERDLKPGGIGYVTFYQKTERDAFLQLINPFLVHGDITPIQLGDGSEDIIKARMGIDRYYDRPKSEDRFVWAFRKVETANVVDAH